METFVGVDGCKAGWFAVCITRDGVWSHDVFDSAASLFARHRTASRILIDTQIGLVDESTEGRRCESEGRKLLGPARRSSIFVAPSRRALSAKTYPEASGINQRATGRKLSKQTWWIMPKIREVDDLLRSEKPARDKLAEVNVELLFWALAESSSMSHYKKTSQGLSERLSVLARWYPRNTELYEDALFSYPRKEVSRDDIVDATAAAVSCFASRGKFQEVPAERQVDSHGLPMRMVIPDLR